MGGTLERLRTGRNVSGAVPYEGMLPRGLMGSGIAHPVAETEQANPSIRQGTCSGSYSRTGVAFNAALPSLM